MDKRAAPGMIGETIGEGHYGLVLIGDANVRMDVFGRRWVSSYLLYVHQRTQEGLVLPCARDCLDALTSPTLRARGSARSFSESAYTAL